MMVISNLNDMYWQTAQAAHDQKIKYLGGVTSFWEETNSSGFNFNRLFVRTGKIKDVYKEATGLLALCGILFGKEIDSFSLGPNGEIWYWELPCHFARKKPKINQVYGWEKTLEAAMERCDKYLASIGYTVVQEKHRALL